MWQRFSEKARKVIFYAQEEAQKFGEGYVSTEHLLLGIIREPDNTAARVLEKLGVSLNRIRAEVEKQLPRGDARSSQDMTLSPKAKRVIDFSYYEARNLSNSYIGTEHLLLGLIREGDGLAGRVLAKLGVDLEAARKTVMDIQDKDRDPYMANSSGRGPVHQPEHVRDWHYQLTLTRVKEWATWAESIVETDLPLANEIAELHMRTNSAVSELNKNLLLALCLEVQEGGSLVDSENWKQLRLTKEQAEAMAQIGAELRKLLDT